MTFDELEEPDFGDDPDRDNGTGPRTGPVWEGVLAAVPQREGVVHRSHQKWLHAVYSNVYAIQSKMNELGNRQIESFSKLLKKLN